ncbi:hypothetical protein [Ralstonia chuxiongensis]|uniref:hypothetical protein n=1 Tax=Ralstonia chuxiongensis TaxID=2957504 RepID=UPI00292E6A04|nr:hypothetical protein [Ralstonia chuxiongensis]
MFEHRSVPWKRDVGRQPTPPFMRIDVGGGKFAFLIPHISRAYAPGWGVHGTLLRHRGAEALSGLTACTLRASGICWIYSPNKDSQFDAHFAIAR